MDAFIVTTSVNGSLFVTDLWPLPEAYVRPSPHCEYHKGHIIYGSCVFEKDIWRLSAEFTDQSHVHLLLLFHPLQRDVSFGGAHPDVFKARALMPMPKSTRMYRFVHPTLLLSAFERPGGLTLRTLNYIELSKRHVFLCGGHVLRVFSVEGGEGLIF